MSKELKEIIELCQDKRKALKHEEDQLIKAIENIRQQLSQANLNLAGVMRAGSELDKDIAIFKNKLKVKK